VDMRRRRSPSPEPAHSEPTFDSAAIAKYKAAHKPAPVIRPKPTDSKSKSTSKKPVRDFDEREKLKQQPSTKEIVEDEPVRPRKKMIYDGERQLLEEFNLRSKPVKKQKSSQGKGVATAKLTNSTTTKPTTTTTTKKNQKAITVSSDDEDLSALPEWQEAKQKENAILKRKEEILKQKKNKNYKNSSHKQNRPCQRPPLPLPKPIPPSNQSRQHLPKQAYKMLHYLKLY